MYIIDRIENNIVVMEKIDDKNQIHVEIKKIEGNPCEGDVVLFKKNKYVVDKNETKKRADFMKNLTTDFWK